MGRSLIDYAREAGEALIELKSRVGHGNFEPWLNQNLTCSNRQARRYMSVAQDWAEIKACMENEGPLSLTDAVDKPKAKSVVHDRFETPAEDEAWIAEEVRKADEEESSSIPGQIKELPIDSDPEVDPRLKEKYREIRQRFATLEKTLLPQVGDYLHALSQLIPPKGRRKQGGFPQQAWEDALETIYGAVTAWKPRDHCPHCKLAGCDQCGGLGWLRKRQR